MNRDLDGCERLYWIANQWSPNNVTALCHLDGVLDLGRLAAALEATTEAHPLLQTRVMADLEGRNPRMVRYGTQALPIYRWGSSGDTDRADVDDRVDERISGLLEHELNQPIDAAQGMARLTWTDDGIGTLLAFSCLHVIGDATAAMIALSDILCAYEDPGCLPRRRPRLPYADQIPPLRRGGSTLPSLVPSQLSTLVRRPARLPAQASVPLEARQNRVVRHHLSPVAVTDLKDECERRGVTIHGLLVAALALSIGEELGLRDRKSAPVNVGSPVSLRSKLRPPVGDELGSYVATLPCVVDVGRGQILWSAARQVNGQIAKRIARGEPFALLDVARWLTPKSRADSRMTMNVAEKAGPGNVCVSNIGQVDFPEQTDGIGVRQALWSASLSFSGYFLCSVVTTGTGMSLTFSYMDDVVDSFRAERIVSGMVAALPVESAFTASRAEAPVGGGW